jgi:hypothetical protein
MGLSSRFPGQMIPMVTESIVSDGMVVIVGAADNACALPGGASPTVSLLGVIYRPDGSSAAVGDTVDVIISGVYPVIAAGSITANNLITSGGTDGTAIAESAGSGVLVGVLGPALEDGVSGDRVATVINPFIKQGG